MRIGLVGTGAMGSALGASWLAAGHEVSTCLKGRSVRTATLTRSAGISEVNTFDSVIASDIVVSIVPPAAAVAAAHDIAAAAKRLAVIPLVVDLNAVAPSTVSQIAALLGDGGIDLVDGVISGTPPFLGSTLTTVYLSGARADEISTLTVANSWYRAVVLGTEIGAASALKMSTSSMYKGTNALVLQAVLTASHFGVLDAFLEDVTRIWPQNVPRWPWEVALAATKAERFVDEMREIAATQKEAGLPEELFLGVATAFEHATRSDLASAAPETIQRAITFSEIVTRLR